MKWIPDNTGRFAQRPHYGSEELDAECEQVISTFLRKRHGRVAYPVTTDDLTVFIEEKADLDSFADLSSEGSEVDGVTEFRPGRRPLVRIAASLGDESYRENRLRTTLTHEYGHVHFHQFLFDDTRSSQQLFPEIAKTHINRCHRDKITAAPQTDWLEWQAGYACGALLMPVAALNDVVRDHCNAHNIAWRSVGATSEEGYALIGAIARHFQTSKDAARVRLIKRGVIIDGAGPGMGDLLA
jgi:hypothetical protein